MSTRKILIGGLVVIAIGLTAYRTFTAPELAGEEFVKKLGLLVAGWMTFCILSFLYRDNPLYKLAEHVMVGLAMGFFTVYYIFQQIKPVWWDRFVGGEQLEEIFGSEQLFRWALIIPAILGLLMLTRIFPKVGWLSRWSMAVVIGIGSGIAIPVTIQANITTQLYAGSRLPVDYMAALSGSAHPGFMDVPGWQYGVPLLMIGTICALVYFFFSVPHRGIVGHTAILGVWVLMVGFGASFGYTVMARLSLFIGRILYVLKDWLNVIG